jgi:hypothetical protein
MIEILQTLQLFDEDGNEYAAQYMASWQEPGKWSLVRVVVAPVSAHSDLKLCGHAECWQQGLRDGAISHHEMSMN